MPDPFITLQDLTDILGRDVTADDGAVIALDAACDMVRTVAERTFNAGTSTFTLDGTGTDALLIPGTALPVTSVSAVTVGTETITDYTVNDNGILFRGSAGTDPRPVWPSGRQNVTVTAAHGYATLDLPRDVKMVALSLASRMVVQGVALEESVGSARVKYAAASTDLTAGERIVLRKYKPTR